MAGTDDGLEEVGHSAPLEHVSLDLPPGGETGELWHLCFECIGAPRERDFVDLGLDRAYISFFNLLRLQDQLGYSLRDYMYYKKRCGRDAASLEVIDTQHKAQEMVENNETERRIRIIMTKDALTELQVNVSPIKKARLRAMNEEPHVEEDIDEYKVWLAEMVEVYPEMGKEYTDDYRMATIKTYKQWLTTQNKLPDDPTNDAATIPEDETQDNTSSLTDWPSHARRHKEKANGVCGKGTKKRGRGTLKGLTGAFKRIKSGSQKLHIEFSSRLGGPVGINHRTFVDEVSMYTKIRAPLIGVRNWKDVMDNVKESITSDVLNKWDLQNTDNAEQKIMDIARERYKGWRGALSATYKAYKTDAERMKNKPEDVDTIEWYYLLKYFASEDFKKISRKNTNCCKKKKSNHCTGSTPFSQRSFQQRDPETGEEPDDIEVWLSTHTRNGKWTNTASQDVYDKSISRLSERETEQEGSNLTREERNDIFQKTYKEVIGCKTTRIYGHGALAKYPTRAQLMVAQIEHSRVSAADQQKRIELEGEVQKLKEQVARDAAERERLAQEVRTEIEEQEQLKREELRTQLREELTAQFREEMQSMFAATQQSNPPSNTEIDGTPVPHVGKNNNKNHLARNLFNNKNSNSNVTPTFITTDQLLRKSARTRNRQEDTD